MPTTGSAPGPTKRLLRTVSTLRFRLMLWYLLILGIVLSTFSAAIYVIEEHSLYQSLDTILTTTLEQVAPVYDPQLGQLVDNHVAALVILQTPQGQITQVTPTVPPAALPALRRSLSQVKDWGNSQVWGNSGSLPFPTARCCSLRVQARPCSLSWGSMGIPWR